MPVLNEAALRLQDVSSLSEMGLILLESISLLLFPFMVTFLLVFLVIFEYLLGAFAEITCFADRHFYSDWWNSCDWYVMFNIFNDCFTYTKKARILPGVEHSSTPFPTPSRLRRIETLHVPQHVNFNYVSRQRSWTRAGDGLHYEEATRLWLCGADATATYSRYSEDESDQKS